MQNCHNKKFSVHLCAWLILLSLCEYVRVGMNLLLFDLEDY